MKLDRIGANAGALPLDLVALGFQSRQPILHGSSRRAGHNRIDEPVNRGIDRREALFERPDVDGSPAVQFAAHAVVFGDIFGDEIGIGEVMLDPFEHTLLNDDARHPGRIVAKAGLTAARAH
ncbi:hypothetical protein HU230_0038545 [Bradyrhizobium quebecense]|uniref:hypothetical protein n=1 Tax=Bradyrhizobium quebecense TaxID=2748629 RepID=UPI001CD4970F|nr:hypothetical protein [Bradyrhizobium quebecense]UGA44061.1 hypothetical protein HU230_0038545 [Bradyrhizobium quebecense]